jgi:prefoldin subunit 5
MKTLMNIVASLSLMTALPVLACTPEEAEAKREQLAQEVQKLTQQNPTKAKELNQEIKDMHLETASKDVPDKCQLIDQRLRELDEAAKKAEG